MRAWSHTVDEIRTFTVALDVLEMVFEEQKKVNLGDDHDVGNREQRINIVRLMSFFIA